MLCLLVACRFSMRRSSAECRLIRIYEPTSDSSASSCMQHIQSKFNATLSHQLDSFRSFWIVRCHCELSTLGFNWLTTGTITRLLSTTIDYATPRSNTSNIVRVFASTFEFRAWTHYFFITSVTFTAHTHTHIRTHNGKSNFGKRWVNEKWEGINRRWHARHV